LFSAAARQEARLTAVVVFPTPPFWLAIAIFLPRTDSLINNGFCYNFPLSLSLEEFSNNKKQTMSDLFMN
jgi:hypothetical protein